MICVEKLSMTQGTFSLRDVSFEVHEGQYAVLTGKSGSGKTSILEAICGLLIGQFWGFMAELGSWS